MKAIVLAIFLFLMTACSSEPFVHSLPKGTDVMGSNEIYVVSHGWHTGFVVSAKKMEGRIPQLKNRFGDIPFLEIGWGDKGFYEAQEITTGLTLRAMFWSSGSVIHVAAVPYRVNDYFAHSKISTLCLSDAAYASLIAFIADSFKHEQGKLLPRIQGRYGDSQFYEGVGYYHLFNTCNKWTAKGLKSAGLDISPAFKLTAGSVMDSLQGMNQLCPKQMLN